MAEYGNGGNAGVHENGRCADVCIAIGSKNWGAELSVTPKSPETYYMILDTSY